jgi:hypothetical protein
VSAAGAGTAATADAVAAATGGGSTAIERDATGPAAESVGVADVDGSPAWPGAAGVAGVADVDGNAGAAGVADAVSVNRTARATGWPSLERSRS